MSTEGIVAAPRVRADIDIGARRTALRIAVGVTAGFVIAEAMDWDFTFIGPMLAAQLLVSSRQPPTIAQGLAFAVVIGVANGAVLLLSTALVSTPPVLILALACILLASFYAQLRGAPDLVTTMFQISAVSIPVFAVITPALAATLAGALFTGSLIALLTVWAAHAALPNPIDDRMLGGKGGGAPTVPSTMAARMALRNTLIVMPVLICYLFDDTQVAVVMLIVIVTVIRQAAASQGQQAAVGLIIGNLIGGLAAAFAFTLIKINDTLIFFTIVCLAASLLFAGRIVTAGPRAPLYGIAFSTFIILLGIGISPLPGGSGEAFLSRLSYVLLATAYAIGALSLFRNSQDRLAVKSKRPTT